MMTFCVRHLKQKVVHSQKIMDVSDVQQYDQSEQQDRERANLDARCSVRQKDCDGVNLDHFCHQQD